MNKMRFSEYKQLHTERGIAPIQKKRNIQYKVIAEKTEKPSDMLKRASHTTQDARELFLYTQKHSKTYALISGFRYHHLKNRDNPGKNKVKYFEIIDLRGRAERSEFMQFRKQKSGTPQQLESHQEWNSDQLLFCTTSSISA